jgi:hypothetical protein
MKKLIFVIAIFCSILSFAEESKKELKFFMQGDLLYWKAAGNGMDYACNDAITENKRSWRRSYKS